MARDNKVRMPSSNAGITQYWDEVKTKFTLRPEYVVVMAILIIILELLLQTYGHNFFG
jgi:preprotein translocase subunit Sec61beta